MLVIDHITCHLLKKEGQFRKYLNTCSPQLVNRKSSASLGRSLRRRMNIIRKQAWLPNESSNIMKDNRNTDFFWNHLRNQFRFMQEDRWKLHFLHLCSCSYRISGKSTITKLYVFTCIHRTGVENCEGSVRVFKLWYSHCMLPCAFLKKKIFATMQAD